MERVIPEEVQVEVTEARSKIVASLLLTGTSLNEIANQLKTTRPQITKLMKTEEFKTALSEVSDHMVSTAANTWKGMMQELIPIAYKTLKKALEKGDLRGVEVVMKSIGVDKQQQVQTSGNIQVVLPDFKNEKSIEVTLESKNGE